MLVYAVVFYDHYPLVAGHLNHCQWLPIYTPYHLFVADTDC